MNEKEYEELLDFINELIGDARFVADDQLTPIGIDDFIRELECKYIITKRK